MIFILGSWTYDGFQVKTTAFNVFFDSRNFNNAK